MATQKEQQENLNTTVARMDERLKQMSEDIKEIKQSLSPVTKHEIVLYGTGAQPGLIEKFNNMEDCVENIKEWRKKVIAIFGVIAVVGSGVGMFIKDIVAAILIK